MEKLVSFYCSHGSMYHICHFISPPLSFIQLMCNDKNELDFGHGLGFWATFISFFLLYTILLVRNISLYNYFGYVSV